MKFKSMFFSVTVIMSVTACGETGQKVAFKQEGTAEEASLSSPNSAGQTPVCDSAGSASPACESESDLRARNAEEFVCVYEYFNFKGNACCLERPRGARFVQVPDSNPRSVSSGSLVHHGASGPLSYTANPRVTNNLELECLLNFNPQDARRPECIRFGNEVTMTSGIFGATDHLSFWSNANNPGVNLFGVKTLIFY